MRPRYEALFLRMRDPDQEAADAAFDAVLFDRGQAVPDLAECYRKAKKDPVLRFLVVQLLGFSGSPAAAAVCIEALADRDPSVRAEACRSLEDLHANDAIPSLEQRLADPDAAVREAAADALAELRAG